MVSRKKKASGPLTILIPKEDPLGYDTSDILECARAMADDALAGRHKAAVKKEIEAATQLLGTKRGSGLG